MDRPRFVIEASEAESMAKQSNLTVLQLLPSLVKPAQALARPPISKFHVGAVGYGSSGRIFLGVNLEFPGLPLHYSVHAEQFLVTNLSIHSESKLQYIAVSAAPCGHCRQFFQEIRGAQDIQILITSVESGDDNSGLNGFDPLLRLLPHRFGPEDLLGQDVPLLLEQHENGLSFSSETENLTGDFKLNAELKAAALEAANKSHAPYSGCPSGVAILDSDGKMYKGSYMESAAYNPSLGPAQAAVVAYIVGGGGGYEKIVRAVLVEKADVLVKQEHTARLLFQAISPKSPKGTVQGVIQRCIRRFNISAISSAMVEQLDGNGKRRYSQILMDAKLEPNMFSQSVLVALHCKYCALVAKETIV